MMGRGFDAERHLDRNAALHQEATRCRALWAAVVLNAMNDTAREIRKLREDRRDEKARHELKIFISWMRSRDGREVLGCAGIDYSARAAALMADAVWTGKAIAGGWGYGKRGRVN
ncbi:MAG: hypothetical protein E6Q97_31960 [Desulfurellales bacterium]|nr:MAG: hypothetical protein E6Q97_31960 [Desulfurellales bacterium]